ncbi:MAG: glycosyl hydrolase, partial [Bacteroidota bacterium]
MKIAYNILLLSILITACETPSEETEMPSSTIEVHPSFSVEGKTVKVYNTAENTAMRLSPSANKSFEAANQPLETEVAVFVNPNKSFQTFMGIGGAITDASSLVYNALPEDKQEEFLKAYYSLDEGIGYTLLRTHIHSCDFSKGSYTYVSDEDKELKTFDIAPDREFRIPLLKKAIATASWDLPLYVSPWSPPAFMKTNNNMLQGGSLLPEYRDA